ncbi:MAG: bacillithiol system redox-active protein YtxJ [Saprospiraceae bacterium]
MHWTEINSLSQLDELNGLSKENIVLVFKHSTRCSISDIAYARLQSLSFLELPANLKCFYLDLIRYKELSNLIAERYKVYHESPQILLIKDGDCFFECSHLDISWETILDQMQSEKQMTA